MPIQMDLAALLVSGAMQTGEPVTKLTLGADVISQPNGGASLVRVQDQSTRDLSKKKGGKKKSDMPKKG